MLATALVGTLAAGCGVAAVVGPTRGSMANGDWFAWWPNSTAATTVVATDANGVQLASVSVTK
jgi:hypothetical protein